MIYIKKGNEPASLTAYKKEKFAYFDGCNKDDIRDKLLKEQGYLCAYCMRRIDKAHMKIEHWYPEDQLTDAEALDYRNMLGCCEGHIAGTSGDEDTCDTHKGNRRITVNPLKAYTLRTIQYRSATGEIYSEDKTIENDLDQVLNLNSGRHLLKINRKRLLNQVITELRSRQKKGMWSPAVLEKVKTVYENKDAEGKKKEYAGIVIWYMDKKIKASE